MVSLLTAELIRDITTSIQLAETRLGIKLFPYQIDAILFQWKSFFRRHGALIAYEPGLGKTLIGLIFAFTLLRFFSKENAAAKKQKKQPPYPMKVLVAAPLSVLGDTWTTHSPKLFPAHQFYVHHDERDSSVNIEAFDSAYIIGTSYGIITRDYTNFMNGDRHPSNIFSHQYAAVIADEADVIKNGTSFDTTRSNGPIIAKAMFKLAEYAVVRTALTGTPVSNSLSDLYSLIRFLHPQPFKRDKKKPYVGHWSEADIWKDIARIKNPDMRKKRVSVLTAPFMLWMSKDDPRAPKLPKIDRVVKQLDLTEAQRLATQEAVREGLKIVKAYNQLTSRGNVSGTGDDDQQYSRPVDDDQRRKLRGRIMALFVRLRRICDSHHLDASRTVEDDSNSEDYMSDISQDDDQLDRIKRDSCKFQFTDIFVNRMLLERKKVVIFVHWTMTSSLLKSILERGWRKSGMKYKAQIFDGRVAKRSDRAAILKRFRSDFDEGDNVLIISSQCGGVGLDLSAASVGVVFSPDYTGATEYQKDNRLHRPGQVNPVTIVRLICDDTSIETHIRNIQIRKEEEAVRTVTPLATLIKYDASEANTTSTFSAVMQYLLSMDHKHQLTTSDESDDNIEEHPNKKARR